MEALEAERGFDRERQAKALEAVDDAREQMAAIGGLFITLALQHGPLTVQKVLAKVFNGLAAGAWEKAQAADRRATDALERLDVLTQEVKALRKRLEKVGARHPDRTGYVGVTPLVGG